MTENIKSLMLNRENPVILGLSQLIHPCGLIENDAAQVNLNPIKHILG